MAKVVRDVFIRLAGLVRRLGDAGRVEGTDEGLYVKYSSHSGLTGAPGISVRASIGDVVSDGGKGTS